jgi:protein phosphatase
MNPETNDVTRRQHLAGPVLTDDFEPEASRVWAEFGARSHHGRPPRENDDHFVALRLTQRPEVLLTSLAAVDLPRPMDEHAYAAVVADGIGPAGAGSVAARLAISTLAHLALRFGQWSRRIDPQVAAEVLARSAWLYTQTNTALVQRSQSDADLAGMAAVMTGIYSVGTDLFVAHVGHSRCYLFRDGRLVQLTRDQTLRERLAASPLPTPIGPGIEDVQHILTNALGASISGPGTTVEHFRLADDDVLLLCTNGLTDVVDDDALANLLALRRTLAEQCDRLVETAISNGAADNVTAVLVNYHVSAAGMAPASTNP